VPSVPDGNCSRAALCVRLLAGLTDHGDRAESAHVTVIYEGQGHWWLPGRDDKKVAGTITFDSEKGGTLSLIGALSHWTEYAEPVPTEGGGVMLEHTAEVEERSGSYPRIYGEVNGKAVTLEDAFQTHSSGSLFGSASEERIFVNRLFTEVWWSNDEAPETTALAVNMAYLNDWAIEKYIGEHHIFHDDGRNSQDLWIGVSGGLLITS
jgi:hypothetical protein